VPSKSIVTAACGIAAATGIVIAAASLANASASPSTAAGYTLGYGQQGTAPQGERGPGGGGDHTPVTGSELTKVTAAVKAKDSAVTVTSARKDADGSYDVFGTKAGAQVRVEVSKDLKTVTVDTGGPGGGRGHGGGMGGPGGDHTPVTGSELTKVTAAVKAKDSAVTVTSVRKDADGSYDVLGTKAGAPVMLDVSKDLKTITARTGGPDGHGGPGGHGPDGDGPGAQPGTQSGAPSGTGTNAPTGTATGTSYRTV